jgi:hypothetical protein
VNVANGRKAEGAVLAASGLSALENAGFEADICIQPLPTKPEADDSRASAEDGGTAALRFH